MILQAYAAQAGLRTLSIDQADVAGGGLETVEFPSGSGFLHNTHSFFHRAVTELPWYRDLELERLGARYLEPELNVAMLLSDGGSLQWWTDFEKTFASFADLSEADARTLGRWRDDFQPIVRNILAPESSAPPLEPARRRELLERTAEGRLLLEISRLSPVEFVKREFKSPVIQAGLLFFNGLREVDLRQKGFGHHIPALLASPSKAQMARGGSARLADALVRAVQEGGGTIVTSATPTRILIEEGKAVGVALSDGRTYRARHFIASSLNPHQTFLDLLQPDDLPHAWRRRAEAFQYNLLAPLFGIYLNLNAPIRYSAEQDDPALRDAFMMIVGLDHVEQFDSIVRDHEEGRISETVMWGAAPSRFDDKQPPTGAGTAFMWEKVPYALKGDPTNWTAEGIRHGKHMLSVWEKYAPGLRDLIDDWFVRSPLDTERRLPNMREGDLLIGAFANGQVGFNRPFQGAGHYRAHVNGLYLCGSSCHPGGNITGLPGYNAAQVILGDLGLKMDWMPRPVEEQLAGTG